MRRDLSELDKWLAGKPSAFRKVPVEPVGADEIKKARQSLELSQEKFAAVLGVSPITVRFWESGLRHPEGLARKVLRLISQRPDIATELAKA
jgi:putative transcriptional regulator